MKLTRNQVCEYWLYSKIGLPKTYRPCNKDWFGDVPPKPKYDVSEFHVLILDTAATVEVCRIAVEDTPGYNFLIDGLLRRFYSVGIEDNDELVLVSSFLDTLDKGLADNPVEAQYLDFTLAKCRGEELKPWTIRDIADKTGIPRQSVHRWLYKSGHLCGLNPWQGHWWGTESAVQEFLRFWENNRNGVAEVEKVA